MKSFYLIFTFMVIGSELIVAQPTNSRNYIENTILTKTGVKSIDEAIRLPDYHKRIKISYFDGLGRPIQEILVKASGTNKDIVLAIGYDAIGRKSKEFLAYSASDNKFGIYRANALNINYANSDQYDFYQNNNEASIPTMPNPFNETVFEASPENKIIEKGFPGISWAINNSNKHTLQMSYDFNTLNEVKYWTINTDGISAASSYYEANTLYKIQTTDENGNLIIEYKDKEGLVVCKKVQDSTNSFAITQYVYDDFNLLRYVIPPNAAQISTISETDTTIFMKYIYGYKYDNRNRLIAKKIPGKSDWEELLYNKIDKLVLSRDPQQKAEGYWIFNKYDQLGRLIITGKFITNQTIQLLQALIDSDSVFYENRDKNYSEINTNLNQTGYTNNAQPKVNNTDSSSWLINYYDDYSFLQIPNVKKNIPLKYFSVPSSQTNNQTNNVHGLLTGTRVQVLGSLQYGNNIGGQNVAVLSPAKMLTSMLKYDIFGKLTYQIKQNYLSGVDMYENYYNFAGELITTMRKTYY
ncbi:MAG: DUF6443 domain-containing protein, partial [Sediminibacterium sp.]|nr:DUF6443 domain-containing protein [Sediminibacterium sp.]